MRARCAVLCVLVVVSTAFSQKRSANQPSSSESAKLLSLKVTGTTRYTEKEILLGSGLQIGQNAADGDFKEAAHRLGSSGMFGEVAYSYASTGAGVRVEFQVSDIDQSKLVLANFENFVWFTDDQLLTALQTRVPLFKKLLPLTGNLPDELSETLQSLLNEKQYPGRVDFLRVEDEKTEVLTAIDYKVENISIHIHGIEFPGATPELAALLTDASHRVIGGEYVRASLAAVAKFDLMPVYLQRGYLKAVFAATEARVIPESAPAADAQGPVEIQVDVIMPVMPGKVYSLSGIDWSGNSAMTASEITPLIHLTAGQPADAVRLGRDLEGIEKLYRSRGYITAQIKSEAQFDGEKNTVHYQLHVIEGDRYRMGELEIVGLDTQAKARLVEEWKMQPGQFYDAGYAQKFVADTESLLPRGPHWGISIHESPDPRDKTVDVEIRFKQQ